jgi:hypothetical protein
VFQRVDARFQRRLELLAHVTRMRSLREKRGAPIARDSVREPQRARVLCGRFAMRVEPRRPRGSGRREHEHRFHVARHLRVMRDSCRIRRATRRIDQRPQGGAMQGEPAVGRDRFLEGNPCELVPEGHDVSLLAAHSRGEDLLEMRQRVGRNRLEQPELGVRRNDRDGLEHPSRIGSKPGRPRQHRVVHARGNLPRIRVEQLGDVKRIAAGLPVDLVRVEAAWLGESVYRLERKRRKLQTADVGRRCELTEDDP